MFLSYKLNHFVAHAKQIFFTLLETSATNDTLSLIVRKNRYNCINLYSFHYFSCFMFQYGLPYPKFNSSPRIV